MSNVRVRLFRRGERISQDEVCGCDLCVEARSESGSLVAVVEDGRIWVSHVVGRLKELLDAVVKHIGINRVVFCNVINEMLLLKLRNIVNMFTLETMYGDETVCYEVVWSPEHRHVKFCKDKFYACNTVRNRVNLELRNDTRSIEDIVLLGHYVRLYCGE